MKILIDARLYGPEHTGNGRYTKELIGNLNKLDKSNQYILLLRKENMGLSLGGNFKKVLADFRHYTFTEQFRLLFIIRHFHPDLVHFPHFNVPLFYFGKYVVTIHDLIMHNFRRGTATTRNALIYMIFRIGYHLSFAKAVYGAQKIIVPSNFVKKELLIHYGINPQKVKVIYE